MKALLQTARSASPYLVVEAVLPGGTLIAALMWMYRHRAELRAHGRRWIEKLSRT